MESIGPDMLNAVARIRYETSNAGGFCTGTLLNERISGTFIPFFLTANHCISTQEGADSVVAEFFFRRSSCGGSGIIPTEGPTGGASYWRLASHRTQHCFDSGEYARRTEFRWMEYKTHSST